MEDIAVLESVHSVFISESVIVLEVFMIMIKRDRGLKW